MQFSFHEGLYKAARITGPSHNMLGLSFSSQIGPIEVVELPVRPAETVRVQREDVIRQVVDAQNEFNAAFGTSYLITKIAFLPSDTYSDSVYKQLTLAIMKRLVSGEVFRVV